MNSKNNVCSIPRIYKNKILLGTSQDKLICLPLRVGKSGVETRSNQVNVFEHVKTFCCVYPFHYKQDRRILLR